MSAVNRILDQLHTHLKLRGLSLVIFKKECRIATELAEPCEFGEDLDLVRLELCLALAV